MYQIFIYIYLCGVAVASLFSRKVSNMWRGERQSIDIIRRKVIPGARYVWVHAASLGEFEQGRPLMEYIRREHPEYKILLTFFSPSGYEVRKDYPGADIICYLPIDTPRNARRFLRAIRPEMAFFIKYEFWYNYLHIMKHRGVPTYSVSSIFRDRQIFFRWYGRGYGKVLRCFTKFFVQNEKSRDLLHTIGIKDVEVTGDTRFDRVLDIRRDAKQLPIVERFKDGHRTFVAGSSWLPDEELFIPYFHDRKEWRLIIAPHVISEEHLRQIEALAEQFGRRAVRYSALKDGSSLQENDGPEASVLIIDCFGLLSSIYSYGEVAYVGGGFGAGIHNLLEAAVWNKPVFFGPNNGNFQEAQDLKECGGGLEVTTPADFNELMQKVTSDDEYLMEAADAAGNYVKSRAGALARIMHSINL